MCCQVVSAMLCLGTRRSTSVTTSRCRRTAANVSYSGKSDHSSSVWLSLAGAGRVWSVAASSAAGQCTNWYRSSITAGVIRSVE